MSHYYGRCSFCKADDAIDVDTGYCCECGKSETEEIKKERDALRAEVERLRKLCEKERNVRIAATNRLVLLDLDDPDACADELDGIVHTLRFKEAAERGEGTDNG